MDDDEEFELIGDVSETLQTDNTSETTANGNDLRTNNDTGQSLPALILALVELCVGVMLVVCGSYVQVMHAVC